MKRPSIPFTILIASVLLSPTAVCRAEESRIVSWNAHSRQFIDPPAFQILPSAKAVKYQAVVKQGDQAWSVESPHPWLDLAPIWDKVPRRWFQLTIKCLDAGGKVVAQETSWRVKAPDWQGFNEPPEDWAAAADRTIAYLIRIGEEGTAPYREPGMPVWMWSAASAAPEPTREMLGPAFDNKGVVGEFRGRHQWATLGHGAAYPACIVPAIIWSMTANVELHRPQSETAMKMARLVADWALKNRLPNEGAMPLFPYSTIAGGKFGGGLEEDNINLTRASWMGLAMVSMYEATRDPKYLDYARHIANVTTKFQAPDGGFPYRVKMKTGEVKESYCTGGIQFSLLVEALERHGVDEKLQMASERAIQWMLSYPAESKNWQGGYEDVGEVRPYRNLTQWEPQVLIAYLCRNKDRNPSYIPWAKKMLRFVEDQFVLFGPESQAYPAPLKGPLVFEQYVCWWPMEVHAGYYLLANLELHRATGEQIYLDKAKAAGNAICAQQYTDGSISNWGSRWLENGKPKGENSGHNWYNCNANAAFALYRLAAYCGGDAEGIGDIKAGP
ncbi:MAG: hypothetical protein IT426_03325 [Pirellulales bacterium]|nr:hypothetical protein [Pirellulales bacterium]